MLHLDNPTLIQGKDGDGDVVFTIAIVEVNPGEFQLQTTLFEALKHGDNSKFDEAVQLLLEEGTVQLKYEVTRTDGDNDPISKSATIDLISDESSYFTFDDDGPTAGTVVDPDILDDEGLTGGIKGGSDDAPGELISTGGTLTRDFGSDGPGEVSFANLDGKTTTLGTETIDLSWDDGLNKLTGSVGARQHLHRRGGPADWRLYLQLAGQRPARQDRRRERRHPEPGLPGHGRRRRQGPWDRVLHHRRRHSGQLRSGGHHRLERLGCIDHR